jgi:hypothetical protein
MLSGKGRNKILLAKIRPKFKMVVIIFKCELLTSDPFPFYAHRKGRV